MSAETRQPWSTPYPPRQQWAPPQPPPASRWRRATSDGRRLVAYALIVIASLLVPLAVTAFWVSYTLLNEDRFVETLTPLARDPDIQDVVAERVSTELIAALDTGGTLSEVIPGVGSLIEPLTGALDGVVTEGVRVFVGSSLFEGLWAASLRGAHSSVVSLLEGDNEYAAIEEGEVKLDLREISLAAVDQIPAITGTPALPGSGVELVIFRSAALEQVQAAFGLLKKLAVLLPLVTLLLYGAAVALARRRLRALMWAGVGAALGATLLVVTLGVLRDLYVSSVAGPELAATLPAVFDAAVRQLLAMSRALFVFGVVAVGAAVIAGPWSSWVRTESTADGLLGRAGHAVASSFAGPWIHRYRGLCHVALILLGAAVLVAWPAPGALVVLLTVMLVSLAVAVVELVAQVAR